MKVNNVLVGEKNYYSSSNKGNLRTQMGSGRLGNDMNGASPLSGAIDNLTLPSVGFYDFELPDSAGIAFVSDVTDGRAAFCDDFQSCPLVTEGGTFGHALSFDGVDDRLTVVGRGNRPRRLHDSGIVQDNRFRCPTPPHGSRARLRQRADTGNHQQRSRCGSPEKGDRVAQVCLEWRRS